MRELVSKSIDETERFGREIAGKLKPGDIAAFTGGLGSGKTCIIKSICRELGIKDIVTSPTFTLMHIYEGDVKVLHLDCYRLRSAEEALLLGLDEYFYGDYISLIEWADRIRPILPDKTQFYNMIRVAEHETWRTITFIDQ
ncbi:tRNA (adenosine(37)-N6)-threonylcarbamoyltransferase complex ATPase subunit type 1 TsaE [candidate division KSB1 bacterium]